MSDIDKSTAIKLYRTMVRIRVFETVTEKLFLEGKLPGFVHLYIGEEAIAAGVSASLRRDDYILSTHRGHGHTLAKGGDMKKMMAENYGKVTGYCKGKGGSMHIADFSIGMLGANGVVGGQFPISVGAGLSIKMRKTDQVVVAYFGDGAANRGTFHEALNMASIWKLPIIFVNEDNQYASTTRKVRTLSVEHVAQRACAYNVPGIRCDGNDVIAVYKAAKEAIERARRGEGPTLMSCQTYRLKGHFIGDPEKYRTHEEVEEFWKKEPIGRFEKIAFENGWLTEDEKKAIWEEYQKEAEEAVKFAEESPYPDPEEALKDVFVNPLE